MEESYGGQVLPTIFKTRLMVSVMIQKLDKKALALRLFGRDRDGEGQVDGENDTSVQAEE